MYVISSIEQLASAVTQLRISGCHVRLHRKWREQYPCLRSPKLNGCYTKPRAGS